MMTAVALDARRHDDGTTCFDWQYQALMGFAAWCAVAFVGMVVSGLHPAAVGVFYVHVFVWLFTWSYTQVRYVVAVRERRRRRRGW